MSAEPIDPGALPWYPDPVRQRLADFTIEDVLAIPEDVTIVVEIVSPRTRRRDRMEKPAVYADACPNFWRVEQDPVHVYAYTLKNGAYEELANSAEELVVDEPFPTRLPIREITP
jgi:Uma2 family endonuclease